MSDQFIGQTLADKYRIDEVLREGEFGKIYRGRHLLMEKPVTVKILSPALTVDEEIVRQFSREAKTVSNITHPNILNVNDFGTDKSGAVYIIMEGAEGDTLENALNTERNFTVERAVRIARQIAAALSAAHSQEIVHKNLNPENVLLTEQSGRVESVKISGFGSFDKSEEHSFENSPDLRNIEYRAPELDSDISAADARSDIYSLGVIFYQMLAGEVPFMAENLSELSVKKTAELPAPLSAYRNDLPETLEPVILKALSKNADARQQTASEFIEELNRATGFSNELETVIAAPQTQAQESNNLWKTAFIVLAGISILSVGLIYATYTKQTDPTTALQYDANGQPVQPINPATGLPEMGASNMVPYGDANSFGNANITDPGQLTYPDGVDPWGRGAIPPSDSSIPYPVQPGGEIYTIPGNSGSVFMPQADGSGNIILIPVPANTNTNTAPPAKSPKTTPANAQTSPTPAPTQTAPTPEVKQTPAVKPAQPKPTEQPRQNPAASPENLVRSGKLRDAD